MQKLVFLIVFLCLAPYTIWSSEVSPEQARNWHQWRGPYANGVATTADPPIEWSESKNIKWKVEVPGRGSSSPIVWNDRIYVLTAVRTDRTANNASAATAPQAPQIRGRGRSAPPTNYYQFVVVCYDRETGKKIWQRVAAEAIPNEGLHQTNTHASGSATTDGKYLYASFGSYGIFCYDMDGAQIWKRDLGDMRTRNGFGEGSSPTLYRDTLVVTWDHEDASFIVALNAATGDTRWKVDRDEPTTWATPLVVEHAGRTQVITNGTVRVRSYDLATGELIWECGGQATNPIPSPIAVDGVAYCMTGYRGYAVYALPLGATGDITDSEDILWRNTNTGPYISSPVPYGGQLYVTKGREAILSSFDVKSGEPVFGPQRLPGLDTLYSSPVATANRIYFADRDGTTLVIKHGTELDVLATNRLDEGIDASPAIVGNQLFVRGEKHLYCIAADR